MEGHWLDGDQDGLSDTNVGGEGNWIAKDRSE